MAAHKRFLSLLWQLDWLITLSAFSTVLIDKYLRIVSLTILHLLGCSTAKTGISKGHQLQRFMKTFITTRVCVCVHWNLLHNFYGNLINSETPQRFSVVHDRSDLELTNTAYLRCFQQFMLICQLQHSSAKTIPEWVVAKPPDTDAKISLFSWCSSTREKHLSSRHILNHSNQSHTAKFGIAYHHMIFFKTGATAPAHTTGVQTGGLTFQLSKCTYDSY